MKKISNRYEFEQVADSYHGPFPVMLEDRRVGLVTTCHPGTVLVDAYDGNNLQTLSIPYKNFYHLGNGAFFSGLKGATPVG